MSDQEKKRASVDKAAGEANEMSEERLTFSCSYEWKPWTVVHLP